MTFQAEARTTEGLADTREIRIRGRVTFDEAPELRKVIYDRSVRRPEGYMDKPVTEEGLLRGIRKILELAHEEELAHTE